MLITTVVLWVDHRSAAWAGNTRGIDRCEVSVVKAAVVGYFTTLWVILWSRQHTGKYLARRQHQHNVPTSKGKKHEISLKILHQGGFKTAQQAATLANPHALIIAPRPNLANLLPLSHAKFLVWRDKCMKRVKTAIDVINTLTLTEQRYFSINHGD